MKLKSLFITSLLSLLFISSALAQDKYEYGQVRGTSYSVVFTTPATQETIKTTDLESEKDLLKKINELAEKGWEVYNTSVDNGRYTYFLRKKKN